MINLRITDLNGKLLILIKKTFVLMVKKDQSEK